MSDRAEAKRKELETRRQLGPRIGRSPMAARRQTLEPSPLRIPRVRAGRDHPTRDSG